MYYFITQPHYILSTASLGLSNKTKRYFILNNFAKFRIAYLVYAIVNFVEIFSKKEEFWECLIFIQAGQYTTD